MITTKTDIFSDKTNLNDFLPD